MKRIAIQGLKAGLDAALVEAESGGTVVVTRHGEPIAVIRPIRSASMHKGRDASREPLRPAVRRGSKGRYLAALREDR